jgi:hypothetical protein
MIFSHGRRPSRPHLRKQALVRDRASMAVSAQNLQFGRDQVAVRGDPLPYRSAQAPGIPGGS